MELRVLALGDRYAVQVEHDGAPIARAHHPVELHDLDGAVHRAGYDSFDQVSATVWIGRHHQRRGGATITIRDDWVVEDDGYAISIRRALGADAGETDRHTGVQLGLAVDLEHGETVRFFVPGMAYSPEQWDSTGMYSYADHRLAYPVVAAYDSDAGRVVSLERSTTATFDSAPQRRPAQHRFLQHTDIGSVGFSTSAKGAGLHAAWPYYEGDTGALLDGQGSPARALFPFGSDPLETSLRYRLRIGAATSYADAVEQTFTSVWKHSDPTPSAVPVPLTESVSLRLASAAKTYRRDDDGFAGFALNFDPQRGYGSQARAFGASFAEHEMTGSRRVFEYGFTGRQLNLAHALAGRDPETWAERARAVVDWFVDHMCTESGWVYTLFDAERSRPLYACGDPSGTVMHYLGRSERPGTYTRMMAEAGSDLLLNVALFRSRGQDRPGWHDAAARLAGFFVRTQDADGAWYRAYTPDGRPVTGTEWFGATPEAGKTATSTVIPFLLAAAEVAGSAGGAYRRAAGRAGEYVLNHQVVADEYRGGTLDNPNLVDKEASFLVMRAMLALFDETGDQRWLDAARRAGTVAVTWHSLWDVPLVTGTPLAEGSVRSVGWGGINSVWGLGVSDIYSLFFSADLVRLSVLTGEPLFGRVAELIAHSSLQLLSVPGAMHGFADVGMQPEGISFCAQGTDDGLIQKGDIWGGLGWPYTAGTHGLDEYLDAVRTASQVAADGRSPCSTRQGGHA